MTAGSWVFAVLFALGLGQWLVEYRRQRVRPQGVAVAALPRALVWLCGNPRGDGTVEPACAAQQLASVLFALGALVCLVMGLRLAPAVGAVFLAYLITALPGWIWALRCEQRHERKQNLV